MPVWRGVEGVKGFEVAGVQREEGSEEGKGGGGSEGNEKENGEESGRGVRRMVTRGHRG